MSDASAEDLVIGVEKVDEIPSGPGDTGIARSAGALLLSLDHGEPQVAFGGDAGGGAAVRVGRNGRSSVIL
jgi:hypothetical protein